MVLEKKETKIALGLALLATVGAGVWAYFNYSENKVVETKVTESKTAEENLTSEQPSMVSTIPNDTQIYTEHEDYQKHLKHENSLCAPTEVVTEEEQDRIGRANMMKFQVQDKPDRYTSIISKIKPFADQEKNNQHLDIKMLFSINDALLELCSPKFTDIMQLNRKARREHKAQNNVLNYFQEVFGSMQKIEMMLMSNMQVVLNDLEIPMQKFADSEEYWAKLNPQLAMISLMILDKLKMMMPKNKECSVETALQVFDYQIEIYPSLKDAVTVEDPQLLPMTKQSWMADMVYEKFGLEEEDFMRTLGLDHSQDFKSKAQTLGAMIQADSGMFGDMMQGF